MRRYSTKPRNGAVISEPEGHTPKPCGPVPPGDALPSGPPSPMGGVGEPSAQRRPTGDVGRELRAAPAEVVTHGSDLCCSMRCTPSSGMQSGLPPPGDCCMTCEWGLWTSTFTALASREVLWKWALGAELQVHLHPWCLKFT